MQHKHLLHFTTVEHENGLQHRSGIPQRQGMSAQHLLAFLSLETPSQTPEDLAVEYKRLHKRYVQAMDVIQVCDIALGWGQPC